MDPLAGLCPLSPVAASPSSHLSSRSPLEPRTGSALPAPSNCPEDRLALPHDVALEGDVIIGGRDTPLRGRGLARRQQARRRSSREPGGMRAHVTAWGGRPSCRPRAGRRVEAPRGAGSGEGVRSTLVGRQGAPLRGCSSGFSAAGGT